MLMQAEAIGYSPFSIRHSEFTTSNNNNNKTARIKQQQVIKNEVKCKY